MSSAHLWLRRTCQVQHLGRRESGNASWRRFFGAVQSSSSLSLATLLHARKYAIHHHDVCSRQSLYNGLSMTIRNPHRHFCKTLVTVESYPCVVSCSDSRLAGSSISALCFLARSKSLARSLRDQF
ncbi:hypothetical protein KCU81_g291, partial [Aureobasidium melanogenum]